MTTETILTDEQIIMTMNVPQEDYTKEGWVTRQRIRMGHAIEQAVLQSPEVQALRRDAERYRWLLKNEDGTSISMTFEGNTGATPYINGEELEKAIDAAMEQQT